VVVVTKRWLLAHRLQAKTELARDSNGALTIRPARAMNAAARPPKIRSQTGVAPSGLAHRPVPISSRWSSRRLSVLT
jgi:hypothetical protein